MGQLEAFAQEAEHIGLLQAEAEEGSEQAQREVDNDVPTSTPRRFMRSRLFLTARIGLPKALTTSRGSCERSICRSVT